MSRNNARIMIAGVSSGSGKTLITGGLLKALLDRGKNPAAFKCGPDYIDPMYHSRITGIPSRNLDTFLSEKQTVRWLLSKHTEGHDISVIEGVMGFYDGIGGVTTRASTYELASVTDTPVLLLVDCRRNGNSIAALVKGFLEYRKDSHIAGIILNRISPMLYKRMKEFLEEELRVRVFGYIPEDPDFHLDSRHLGLYLPHEIPDMKNRLCRLAKRMEETLDVGAILEAASRAPALEASGCRRYGREFPALRIGVARDEAFCFIYEDNLQLLRQMGAEIVFFSPLHDAVLPEALDGLLLYGGYPELYAKELSGHKTMLESIRKYILSGLPCMAECGGFMILHETMEGMDGKEYPMTGVISGRAFRTERLQRFGYVTLKLLDHSPPVFGCREPGDIPAHEFHYYDSDHCGGCFSAEKPVSGRKWSCMHAGETILAGFPHLYYYGNPKLPEAFLRKCAEYHDQNRNLI